MARPTSIVGSTGSPRSGVVEFGGRKRMRPGEEGGDGGAARREG